MYYCRCSTCNAWTEQEKCPRDASHPLGPRKEFTRAPANVIQARTTAASPPPATTPDAGAPRPAEPTGFGIEITLPPGVPGSLSYRFDRAGDLYEAIVRSRNGDVVIVDGLRKGPPGGPWTYITNRRRAENILKANGLDYQLKNEM